MNAVIGTAGHVDHGKSSLIQALTGIHPSHLPQELLRSMTIDLGFAYFKTPEGSNIGIIDVPGHERFIRNMVSAVWGLDLVLFVVAADEGWATLSTEHLRIISAMGITNCILVLNKCDLVDQNRLAEVENNALEHFLETMELIPDVVYVSSFTGNGIEQLKQAIIAKTSSFNNRAALEPFAHLYVDRVFSVNGVGTTVTGTLRSNAVTEGEVLTLFPSGQSVKIRSLQSYHEQLKTIQPYARAAIGLKQVSKKTVARGSCLVANPDAVIMTTDWIIQLNPQFSSLLKKQSIVELALGTAHVRAKCFVYAGGLLARLVLEESIPAFWGQRLLLIQHGGSSLIGAGRLVWSKPITREMRKILQEKLSSLTINDHTIQQAKLVLELELNGYAQQAEGINLPTQVVSMGNWWVRENHLASLCKVCNDFLNNAINAVGVEDLARVSLAPSSLIEVIVTQECQAGRWQKIETGIVATSTRQGDTLPASQQNLLNEIKEAGTQGFESDKSTISGIKPLLRALTERQLIIPTEDNIFFGKGVYDELVRSLMINRHIGDTFGVADARERTQLARKQIIPLLNRLERDGWVKRVGNDRKVCRAYEGNGVSK